MINEFLIYGASDQMAYLFVMYTIEIRIFIII